MPHTTPNTLKPLRRADEHWLSEVRVGNCSKKQELCKAYVVIAACPVYAMSLCWATEEEAAIMTIMQKAKNVYGT